MVVLETLVLYESRGRLCLTSISVRNVKNTLSIRESVLSVEVRCPVLNLQNSAHRTSLETTGGRQKGNHVNCRASSQFCVEEKRAWRLFVSQPPVCLFLVQFNWYPETVPIHSERGFTMIHVVPPEQSDLIVHSWTHWNIL